MSKTSNISLFDENEPIEFIYHLIGHNIINSYDGAIFACMFKFLCLFVCFMFSGAIKFNRDISRWDVSQVTNMYSMFAGASSFNCGLNSWNIDNVTDINSIFYEATSFDPNNVNQWLNKFDRNILFEL